MQTVLFTCKEESTESWTSAWVMISRSDEHLHEGYNPLDSRKTRMKMPATGNRWVTSCGLWNNSHPASEWNSNVLSTDDQNTSTPGAEIFPMSSLMTGHLNRLSWWSPIPKFRTTGNPKLQNIYKREVNPTNTGKMHIWKLGKTLMLPWWQ